jgi:hypothetical protein
VDQNREVSTQTVSAFAQKIRVRHYGGYEHLERISELESPRARDPLKRHETRRSMSF